MKESVVTMNIIAANAVIFTTVHRIMSTAALDGMQRLRDQQCILVRISLLDCDNESDSNDCVSDITLFYHLSTIASGADSSSSVVKSMISELLE